jgi:hypothetical protein
MRRNWNTIKKLNLWKVNQLNLPYRMSLERVDGSIVMAGGINVPETAVSLFATAHIPLASGDLIPEFGRIPPRNLAVLIAKHFKNRMSSYPYDEIYNKLSKDKSKFLQGKYQELDE